MYGLVFNVTLGESNSKVKRKEGLVTQMLRSDLAKKLIPESRKPFP